MGVDARRAGSAERTFSKGQLVRGPCLAAGLGADGLHLSGGLRAQSRLVLPAFAHPWTHAQSCAAKLRGLADVSYEVRVGPGGLVIFAPATPSADDAFPSGPVVAISLTLPNRITAEPWLPVDNRIVMRFVSAVMASSRLDSMRTAALPLAGRGRARFTRSEPVVFRQNRLLPEGVQSNSEQGSNFARSIKTDTFILPAPLSVKLT